MIDTHLPLPLAKPCLVRRRSRRMAQLAGYALFVKRVRTIHCTQRFPTRKAHRVIAGGKAMPHRHALIEHVALTLPAAFRFRHVLQIFQDAALQVEDFG